MAVYVSDLLTAIPAPVDVAPASAQTWQWLRSSTAISGATGGTYTTTLADLGTTLAVTQTETNFLGAASATSANTEVVQAYDPNALFRFSEPGVWFDPNDITTLYKGPPSATLVTTPGDSVGTMLDKSKGLAQGPELVTNGNNETAVFNFGVLVNQDTLARASAPAGGFAASFTSTTSSSVAHRSYDGSTSLQANRAYRFTGRVYVPTGGVSTFKIYDNGDGSWFGLDITVKDQWISFDVIRTAKSTNWSLGIGNNALDVVTSGQVSFWLDDLSIREVAGNHATQPTFASQPIYGIVPAGGRRNIMTYSEDWSNIVWTKSDLLTPTNAEIAPDGTLTAWKIVPTAVSSSIHRTAQFVGGTAAVAHTMSVYAKATGYPKLGIREGNATGVYATFDLSLGTLIEQSGGVGRITPVGNGWYRCSVSFTSGVGVRSDIGPLPASYTSGTPVFTFTGDGVSGTLLWGAQIETGSLATPYQRVTTQYDVTEAGVPSLGYLYFDGASDFMSTPTITPGIDKAQIFVGVRKFTDAVVGMVVETGTGTENGTVLITAPRSTGVGNYRFISKGTILSDAFPLSGYVAPITNVITGTGDISGDRSIIRVDGTQVAPNTSDQGTGNYLAYPIYIGSRGAGASLFLQGQLFPLIVRFGTNLTAARITATENWMATQTPLQWTVGSGFWNDAYPWSDISAWRD